MTRPVSGRRPTRVALVYAVLLCWLNTAACEHGGGDADDAPSAAAPAATPSTPEAPPPPPGTLERILYDKAQKYAAGLPPLGGAIEGTLEAGEHRDQLLVLDYGKCYRVVGVGGPEAEDLDLVLYDPDNVQVQRDLAQDPYPVLGEQAEICPPMAGAYRLQVTMFKGRGRYLVRAYVLGE